MRNFEDFIEASAAAVGESSIPLPFRKWTALSAVAGALGRSVWYDAGAFKIRSNLFVVLIAGPGRNKSVSLILPFDNVFKALATPPGTHHGDAKYNTSLPDYGLEDMPLHLISDRITPEKLAVDMVKCARTDLDLSTPLDGTFHDSSLTMATSEFGAFMSRNDHYLQMFMTDMWDAKAEFSYKTKTAGEYVIEGPCLNWIACATPDQFVENLPENARSQGLLSRIIPVYYDGPRVEEDIWYGKPDKDTILDLRQDLARIAKLKGEMKFDPTFLEQARTDIQSGLEPRPTDPNMAEYLQRRTSHLFKVAMSVSASCREDLIIGEQEWETAKELLLSAEKFMPTALSFFGIGKAGRIAFDLADFVAKTWAIDKSPLPIAKVRREIMKRVATAGEVEQTLKAMVDSGLLRMDGDVIYPQKK